MKQYFELYFSEIRYLLKTPIYYLAMIIAIIFCFALFYKDIVDPSFPYDSREKYENKIGYMDFQTFEQMNVTDISGSFALVDNQKIHLYEDHMTSSERLKLQLTLDDEVGYYGYTKQYHKLFSQYEAKGKVIDYGYYHAEQLDNINEDVFEKVKHSLFSPQALPNYFSSYGENAQGNRYSEIPTYKQAVEKLEVYQASESFSSVYAREFTRKATIVFVISSLILSSFLFIKDFNSKILDLVNKSTIKSYKYITSKYLALNTVTISGFFLIYFGFFLTLKNKFAGSPWIFEFSDFFYYFLIQTIIAVLFINAFAILMSLLFKNGILAFALSFVYNDFSSQSDNLSNGQNGNEVNYLKFNYYFDEGFNVMTAELKQSVWMHQLFYLFLTAVIIGITIFVWNRILENKEGNIIGPFNRTNRSNSSAERNFGKWQGLYFYNLKLLYSVRYQIFFIVLLLLPVLFDFPSSVLFEILFPLFAVFIFADMMSVEKNSKMDQLFSMTALNKGYIFVTRILINGLFFIVSFFFLWFYVNGFHLYMDLSESIAYPMNFKKYFVSYIINVFLFGFLALTLTNVTKNHIIGLFISLIYWLFWWSAHFHLRHIIFDPFPYTAGVENYWSYRGVSLILIIIMFFINVRKLKNS